MSISKITAALASAHNENTLALANINFDFSLFKVEAPTEYQALGASLSHKRRTEAEAGTQHITARKLGALFDQILPSTPNLSKAYGRRVSEISANKAVNPRGTKSDGFFTNYVGADGTTIWAAATSGQAAISVHLLACMLARIWSGPEATSVWVELVKRRKREIEMETMYEYGQPINIQLVAAAQQDLTRNQLADWDASARAWLQTADEAKKLQQKQLMLILDNLRLPVNHNKIVYQSVIQAWKTAMNMMENLIKGMPQLVQDGAVLLGLSAWHLYPDMVILGNAMADVGLNDSLVAPGGSLTIGLTNVNRSDDDSGVYWSLPLRHLRYYGDPVVSSRSAGGDPSRITFEQLEMAVLGSVLSGWQNAGEDILATTGWLVTLGDFFESAGRPSKTAMRSLSSRESWVEILVKAARRLKLENRERESWLLLVKLGKRRGHSFLADPRLHPPPMFGLSSLKNILPLLEGDEERVQYLRDLARDAWLLPMHTVIRYSHQRFFEFATAVPHMVSSSKRSHSGLGRSYECHVRWTGKTRCDCHTTCTSSCSCALQKIPCSQLCHAPGEEVKCSNTTTTETKDTTFPLDDDARAIDLELRGEKHMSLCEVFGESLRGATDVDLVLPRIDVFRTFFVGSTTNPEGPSQADYQERRFDYLCGDPECAAIFVRRNSIYSKKPRALRVHRLTPLEVEHVLESKTVRADALMTYLSKLGDQAKPGASHSTKPDQLDGDDKDPVLPTKPHSRGLDDGGRFYYRSLKALELVAQVYKQLPNATIAVSVLCKTLHRASWATDKSLSRSSTFASIAMFESGSLEIEPEMLEEVMAMSSGNSIYVAAPLLCDPYESSAPYEIKRIIGNVGRAGIAMLIPPQIPHVREPKLESWNLINHADFNGTTEDCFKSTTLHISFTGYELPIDTGSHGDQDTEVFLLESLVSVHDQGQWVADLDILRNLSTRRFGAGCVYGLHHESVIPQFRLTAIDNWEEFLDKPESAGFVRAHGNWAARLALTVISHHRGYDTYILEGIPCWRCIEHTLGPRQYMRDEQGRLGVRTWAMFIC